MHHYSKRNQSTVFPKVLAFSTLLLRIIWNLLLRIMWKQLMDTFTSISCQMLNKQEGGLMKGFDVISLYFLMAAWQNVFLIGLLSIG